jgi:hypothetical protein
MTESLPDCIKCGNTRKIQCGYMSRDCVCIKKKVVKGQNIVNEFNPVTTTARQSSTVAQVTPESVAQLPIKEAINVSEPKPEAQSPEILCDPEPKEPAALPETSTNETMSTESEKSIELSTEPETTTNSRQPVGGSTDIDAAQKKRSKRKTEVAYALGRQMGYSDRVIEAMLCEKHYQGDSYADWEYKYADIYVHPLATQLPPGYDPTKWIPGDKARDAFRDALLQYLPNKKRKIAFDDLCNLDLEGDNEPVENSVAQ